MLSGYNFSRSRVADSTNEILDFYTLVQDWNVENLIS
jgi:hypothetical protein